MVRNMLHTIMRYMVLQIRFKVGLNVPAITTTSRGDYESSVSNMLWYLFSTGMHTYTKLRMIFMFIYHGNTVGKSLCIVYKPERAYTVPGWQQQRQQQQLMHTTARIGEGPEDQWSKLVLRSHSHMIHIAVLKNSGKVPVSVFIMHS